jgi:hypothetical protein
LGGQTRSGYGRNPIYSSAKSRCRIDFLQIGLIQSQKDNRSIGPGKQFALNIFAINPGPGRVLNATGITRTFILDATEQSDQEAKLLFEKDRQAFEKFYSNGTTSARQMIDVDDGIWTTVVTEPITRAQAEGFIAGKTRFYWISWFAWKSPQGRSDSFSDCRWLQPMPEGTHKDDEMV